MFRLVYGQFCIETLHERHNGNERLVVCLSEYLNIRMDYSCHGRYKGIQFLEQTPDSLKIINFLAPSLVSVNSIQKDNQHAGTSPGIL